jgi:hypothetical protein
LAGIIRRSLPSRSSCPPTESYSILLKSVFIKTENPKSQAVQGLSCNGVLEMAVKGKDVVKLPVKSTYAVKVDLAFRPTPTGK